MIIGSCILQNAPKATIEREGHIGFLKNTTQTKQNPGSKGKWKQIRNKHTHTHTQTQTGKMNIYIKMGERQT